MAQKEAYKSETSSCESKEELVSSIALQMVCVHYWLIETPGGTYSKGRCKGCGDEQVFRNSGDFSY